jgi:predicted PurR-regulated permease PerM
MTGVDPKVPGDAVAPAQARAPRNAASPASTFRSAVAATAGVVLVLLVAYAVYVVRGILVLVLIALFAAVSLDPVVRWLVGKGLRRSYAVALVLFVFLVLLAAFLWSVVPPLVGQGGRLFNHLPDYLRELSDRSKGIRAVTDRYHLTARLTSFVSELPARLAGGAIGFVQRFLGVVASTLTVLVLSIYFMADMPRLQRGLVSLFPRPRRARAAEIVAVVVDKVGGYMIGNIIISVFAGISAFACLELVRVPYALPLAVTVALTDLIPMIGAALGAVACVTVAVLAVDVWPAGVVVLLFFVGYQQLENYLIAPRVLRNTVDMSSVAVLLAALVGGVVLGLVGAVMAIPIAATVKVVMAPWMARDAGPEPGPAPPPGPEQPHGPEPGAA